MTIYGRVAQVAKVKSTVRTRLNMLFAKLSLCAPFINGLKTLKILYEVKKKYDQGNSELMATKSLQAYGKKLRPGIRSWMLRFGITPENSSPRKQKNLVLNKDITLSPSKGEGEKIRATKKPQISVAFKLYKETRSVNQLLFLDTLPEHASILIVCFVRIWVSYIERLFTVKGNFYIAHTYQPM